jgi:hypothetical protein
VGVVGYLPEVLIVAPGGSAQATPENVPTRAVAAVRLQVMALTREDQGRTTEGGRRLSGLVMDTLIAEAIGGRRSVLLTAIVARENLRSLALCERHGLTSQIAYDAAHVRLSAYFERS